MKDFLNNNMLTVFVLILAIGSISMIATSQFVMGLDGDTLKNLLGGCIYGACKDTKITGNVTDGIVAGCVFAGCKDTTITGQPTPNTATLTVIKKVTCPSIQGCTFKPSDFNIKVTGNNVSPGSFVGSDTPGTKVNLDAGGYTIEETPGATVIGPFSVSFSGACDQVGKTLTATGTIQAGESKECTITNNFVT